MGSKQDRRTALLDVFCQLSIKLERAPTNHELAAAGADRNAWREAFGNFREYDKAARKHRPGAFGFHHVDDVRTAEIPRAPIYLVSTAVSGHPTFVPGLRAMQRYQRHRGAELLTLVCADPASNSSAVKSVYRRGYMQVEDEVSAATTVVGANTNLNENLILHTFKTSAKQIDPTTGTLDMAAALGTCVFPSPKQRLRMVPTSADYPRAVMTTGAITLPDYETDRYMSARTAALAEIDHTMGALVIEIVDERRFHYRQIQFQDDGSFVDLGILYSPNPDEEPRRVGVEIVFGDLHVDKETEEHRRTRYEMIEALQPGSVVVHDLFDGNTINHHERRKMISRSMGPYLLEGELSRVKNELRAMTDAGVRVVVVKSNHDEWLDQYLDRMEWAQDTPNLQIGHRLSGFMLADLDPLAEFCKQDGVVFLARNESFRMYGVELGHHGDRGPNGARGTAKNLSYSLGKAITGHVHAPEIWRTLFVLGSSVVGQRYQKGPSSHCHAHCLLDEFGGRQIVNVVEGEWRLQ